jgi:predicted transcriptional regulator
MEEFAAKIVAAYVRNNPVSPEDLPRVIGAVRRTLHSLSEPAAPAVPINRSVGAETVTCLACGWSGTLLRGHLTRVHAITPAEYRSQWDLPRGHPMVAASFSVRRSALSKSLGLGGWRNSCGRPRRGST